MGGLWAVIRAGVSFIATAITTLLTSPELANKAYQLFTQFLQGLSRVVDVNIIPYLMRASNSRKVLMQSAVTNLVCYAGILLIYEAGIRRPVRYGTPAMEDSYSEYSVDFLMRFCIAAYFFVDNVMLNAAIIKASAIDNPANERSCDCDTTVKIHGKLASAAYQCTNYAAVSLAEYALPVAGVPLRSMLYGRYFVEQGAGGGMCVAHRNDIVNRNNAYSFGMGLSFLTALSVSGCAARKTFGDDVVLLNDAIFCFLVQYFLMLSIHHGKSLPGRELGVDVSYPGRQLTNVTARHAGGVAARYFNTPGKSLDWKTVERELNRYSSLLLQRFLFGADLSTKASREIVLRKPIPKLLFKLYDPTIMKALERLEQWPVRDLAVNLGPVSVSYNTIINWLPADFVRKHVPDYKVKTVQYVSDPRYREYINQAREFVSWIRSVQEDREQMLAAESARRDEALRFIDGGRPALIIEAPAAHDQTPSPVVPSLAAEINSLQMTASTSTTLPSIFAQTQARPVALSGPVNSPIVPVFDAAMVIKKIAGLPCWKDQGAGWGGTKVPDGIEKIRGTCANLPALYSQISNKFAQGAKRGLPANMTNDFYVLIRHCYASQHDQVRCKDLVDGFCTQHLNLAERKLIGLAPQQQPLSGTGGRLRR